MPSRLQTFLGSLQAEMAPMDSPLLASLWHGLKGSWERAHEIVQDESGKDAAWIHAWLHRMEGDLANAQYWYSRAGRNMPGSSTTDEGEAIALTLLDRTVD